MRKLRACFIVLKDLGCFGGRMRAGVECFPISIRIRKGLGQLG